MVIPNDFEKFSLNAKKKRTEFNKFFNVLRKLKSKDVDAMFLEAHEEVFAQTNCLDCANCCKTTGPLFTQKDIERLSAHFRLKPGAFVEKYLRIDEDNDYVLQTLPCVFLEEDNACSIYEIRPKACREFPHTDGVRMIQALKITSKNIEICPAVFEIVEEVRKKL